MPKRITKPLIKINQLHLALTDIMLRNELISRLETPSAKTADINNKLLLALWLGANTAKVKLDDRLDKDPHEISPRDFINRGYLLFVYLERAVNSLHASSSVEYAKLHGVMEALYQCYNRNHTEFFYNPELLFFRFAKINLSEYSYSLLQINLTHIPLNRWF